MLRPETIAAILEDLFEDVANLEVPLVELIRSAGGGYANEGIRGYFGGYAKGVDAHGEDRLLDNGPSGVHIPGALPAEFETILEM